MLRLLLAGLLALGLAACATMPAATANKRIALSFDDTPRKAGPFLSPRERAGLLREALRKAGVEQAVFFVNPGAIADKPYGEEHIRAYAADGHVIANHTARHSNLSKVTLAEFIADIDAAAEFLEDIPNTRPWFRYPYLNEGREDVVKRGRVRKALAERGLINGYATVDASDWFYEQLAIEAQVEDRAMDREALRDLYVESHVEAAEFYDALAREATGRSPAHVMLLHETDLAALYIGDLVASLRARGWTIITADEAYADPFAAYAATYDTPSAQGTLTEMVAWQNGLPIPRWYERNNTALARGEFRRRVLRETR